VARIHKVLIASGLASYVALTRLGRTWGSTPAERRRTLPGDEIVADPSILTTHATTIAAQPSAIWPWLIQMGWHQGGWYTKRWVDRLLFPANWAAAERLLPEYQSRKVGDFIPDGPPESQCGFVIERLEPERCLVLHSTTHIPLSWRERYGAQVDWTWVFLLEEAGSESTRLIFRCRGIASPWWLRVLFALAIIPADFIMSRQMLSGIRERVDRQWERDQFDAFLTEIARQRKDAVA
jgi:hypothetical protein